jgi:hypothetical protein
MDFISPVCVLLYCHALAIRNATAEGNGIVTRRNDKTEFWVVWPSAVILGEQWISVLSAVFPFLLNFPKAVVLYFIVIYLFYFILFYFEFAVCNFHTHENGG